jgi:hypothetical protein
MQAKSAWSFLWIGGADQATAVEIGTKIARTIAVNGLIAMRAGASGTADFRLFRQYLARAVAAR